jgi:poly(3-hydroxybutyrate) depolymerase
MSMNMDRHLDAHFDHFQHLVDGDGDSVAAHRGFYDEYLAVMDLTAEFYLQTVEAVFQKHLIPKGEYRHRGRLVRPSAIRDIGLMTIEGEKDDITGRGQTGAAQALTPGLPEDRKIHHVQPRVGHYGVFNGSRFRNHIQPRIHDFIRAERARARD